MKTSAPLTDSRISTLDSPFENLPMSALTSGMPTFLEISFASSGTDVPAISLTYLPLPSSFAIFPTPAGKELPVVFKVSVGNFAVELKPF